MLILTGFGPINLLLQRHVIKQSHELVISLAIVSPDTSDIEATRAGDGIIIHHALSTARPPPCQPPHGQSLPSQH